jgi:drug/metabolite transporter (DMT)-like permease
MRAKDLAALVLLAAIWGSSYLFIRIAASPLGPMPVAFVRVVIGAAGLLAFATTVRRRGELVRIDRRFLQLGVMNAAVPYGLIALAELHLKASLAAVLNATTPLFTALVVALWNRERLPGRTIAGLAIGFAGVAILVGWNPEPLDGKLVLASLAMLGASLAYGVATVYAKRALVGVSSLAAATGQQMGAAIILAPLALGTVAAGGSDTSPSLKVVLAVTALGLLCTSVAYLLYFHLIANAGAMATSSATFLIPVFGVLWSAIFLDEEVHASMLLGLGLILSSVSLVNAVPIPRLTRALSRATT